jgi:glutamate racemase
LIKGGAPIGVFDSGIGGLTVAHAIESRLPAERIHYFGDTAHMPYGERSPALVCRYATRIARHLVDSGCKALVIACNTASANALDAVRAEVGPDIPVIDVVEPVVAQVVKSGLSSIGVIGTRATVASGLYGRLLRAGGTAEVHEFATPLLAPLIEEGWHHSASNIIEPIIRGYLDRAAFGDLDGLVLGCTHYPLASAGFASVLGAGVKIFDAPAAVADSLAEALETAGLLADAGLAEGVVDRPTHRFEVSDLTPSFSASARVFFGANLSLEACGLWTD